MTALQLKGDERLDVKCRWFSHTVICFQIEYSGKKSGDKQNAYNQIVRAINLYVCLGSTGKN